MRHLFLFIVIATVLYIAWELTPKAERKRGMKFFTRHAFRLGLIIAVIGALAALAYYLPTSTLLS